MSSPVPRIFVELLALDELDPSDAEFVRRELGDELAGELEAITRSNAELLARYPEPPVGSAHGRRSVSRLVTPLAVAAGLLLAFGIAWLWGERPRPRLDADPSAVALGESAATHGEDGSVIRHKGEPALHVHRPESEHPLRDGEQVEPGQLLQISYNAAGATHGVIVSIDGRGGTTLHFPATPAESTRLQPGEQRLDHAFELDDAPHFERFFFVTGAGPLDPRQVEAAAEALAHSPAAATAPLRLPAAWRQTSALVRK